LAKESWKVRAARRVLIRTMKPHLLFASLFASTVMAADFDILITNARIADGAAA